MRTRPGGSVGEVSLSTAGAYRRVSPQDAGICQPIIGGQEARLCAVTVMDRYRNRDFALLSLDIRDRNLSARPTITPIGIRKPGGLKL